MKMNTNTNVHEYKYSYMSVVILNDLSDHFGPFISTSTKKWNKAKPEELVISDMSNFS